MPLVLAACSVRNAPGFVPEFAADVEPILSERCASCHSGNSPAGGWSSANYIAAIGCTKDGAPVTKPGDATAPFLKVLTQPDHQKLVNAEELSMLTLWIKSGAPSLDSLMHVEGWANPRSENWHGAALRAEHFKRMLDYRVPGACGSCHLDAPSQNPKLTTGRVLAPPCTTCHTEAGGVLACSTCHGDGTRAQPPRDPCLFPNGPKGYAHATHLQDSKVRVGHLECTTCHPAVDRKNVISGLHANGEVNVVIDKALAGPDAAYDPSTHSCTVYCHSHKGNREHPDWTVPGPLTCNDCHTAPPASHYAGKCSMCHPGVNDTGTAFLDKTLHMDGQVSLGSDGTGRCGTCHGTSGVTGGPWPSTGAHPAHYAPHLTTQIPCTSCHVVPNKVTDSGHLGHIGDANQVATLPRATLTFSGLATARSAMPEYDPQTQTCKNVACHGAGMMSSVNATPQWHSAVGGDARCGSCHDVPPTFAAHTRDTGCQATICHGAELSSWPDGPRVSSAGLLLHINGEIKVGQP